MTTDPSSFGVTTALEGQSTVLVLRGKVDRRAAIELGIILDSALERRPDSVILDLGELEFMGAGGMVVISNAEKRLADLGVQLTVRSPSVLVNRILAMMETAQASRVERALPEHGHLGSEDEAPTTYLTERFISSLSTTDPRLVMGLPTDPDVVDGALRLVVELAQSCVGGADGVSVSLLRKGVLSTVAASDQTIMAMDADQYATGEGPCVDASLKGHWFHAESIDTESRWPSFTPRARSLGIKAILSSPLMALGLPVGALNIYSRTAESFEVKDQHTAAAFAQKASAILSDARAGVSDAQMTIWYKEALRGRDAVTLAKGVIMERQGVDEDDAFTALRRGSLEHGETLRQWAETLVRTTRQTELRSGRARDD
jgi:anti-anti-sigma factor